MSTAWALDAQTNEELTRRIKHRSDEDFKVWMQLVDGTMIDLVGMTSEDLPDQLYRDQYDDGMSPEEAAHEALADSGYTPVTSHSTISADNGEWKCVCGNDSGGTADGFYPCDENGNEVEPTPDDWDEPLYVCARCGRIIHQDTLAVVAQVAPEQIAYL